MSRNRKMPRTLIGLIAILLATGAASSGHAQSPAGVDLREMRRGVSIFEGVLREALDLGGQQALFRSIDSARVSGRYLAGQGVVVEINTPLRIGRRGFGLRMLDDAAAALDRQLSEPDQLTGALVQRPDVEAMRRSMALSVRRDEVAEYARDVMDQLSELDATAAVDNAVRLAGEAMQALRAMGDPDEGRYREQELEHLRGRLREQQRNLESLTESVQQFASDAATISEEQRQSWARRIDHLKDQWPALRDEALDAAEALRQRTEEVREQQRSEWRAEVAGLELQLFGVLCRYGASIGLPDDESLTVVLPGLGERGDEGPGSADRVHVLARQALLRCQSGDMDTDGLRMAARSYAF
ncbi:MAG: hypothetical protein ACQETO_05230 [Pseudomonadota bacterium]